MNRYFIFIALLMMSTMSSATSIFLSGGNGSTWLFADSIITTNGLPAGGNCTVSLNGSGASSVDASLVSQGDAYDIAVVYWVNNTQVGGFISAPTPRSIVYSHVSIDGLNVQLQYELISSSATLRAFLTLENPTGSDISVPVDYVNNYGSDGSTSVQATSSGDMVFNASDRWLVTDDFLTTSGDPANTTVLFGPGSPLVTPSSVSQTVFQCAGGQGTRATYNLTVPAGETVALMMFQQLNDTSNNASSAATEFDTTPDSSSDLLAGLSEVDVSNVVNWSFNEPPVADAGGPYLVAVDLPIMLDGTATDPNGDALNYQWTAEAGYFIDATLEDPTYYASNAPGIYELTFTATDPGGLSDTAVSTVIVYDPYGGFVTGGGWIDSAAGAYAVVPSLTGKANFGFVSKYKKGASTLTGQTQFQFSAGDLNFHSDSYQWLVVNQDGVNAQYKGVGTVNSSLAPTGEAYGFMLWANDGDNADPSEADTFRIKIWYEDGGEVVVYDNGFDQAIGGGSIVVHTGKGKK